MQWPSSVEAAARNGAGIRREPAEADTGEIMTRGGGWSLKNHVLCKLYCCYQSKSSAKCNKDKSFMTDLRWCYLSSGDGDVWSCWPGLSLFSEPESRDQAWAEPGPEPAVQWAPDAGLDWDLISVIPASSASPCLDQQPSREQTSARMEENQGVAHIFGLSTVFLGLCFIMSMGVFSVYHPYKPGEKIKQIFTINQWTLWKMTSSLKCKSLTFHKSSLVDGKNVLDRKHARVPLHSYNLLLKHHGMTYKTLCHVML